MKFEELVKIPQLGLSRNFENILGFLDTKFDYNRELFQNDRLYINQTYVRLIKQVINSNNDKDRLVLLYSLRGYFGDTEIRDQIQELVCSFEDKSLISQMTPYLENPKQIDNMIKTIESFRRTKTVNQEKIDEIKKIIVQGVLREKQVFLNKIKKEEIEQNDEKIMQKLYDFRENGYEQLYPLDIVKIIKEFSSDDLKLKATEKYFKEVCKNTRDKNNDISLFQFLIRNELYGITEIIVSMEKDENKKHLMLQLDNIFEIYKDIYACVGQDISKNSLLDEFAKSMKFHCVLSLDNQTEEIENIKREGELDAFLSYSRNFYQGKFLGRSTLADIIDAVLKLDSDEEKYKELSSGDLKKAIIAYSPSKNAPDKEIMYSNGFMAENDVISSMKSDQIKIKAYEEEFKKIYQMYTYNEQPEIKKKIGIIFKAGSLNILSTLHDKSLMIDKMIEEGILENFLQYGYVVENKGKIIKDNLDTILNYYQLDNIQDKKDMLFRMNEINSRVYEQMDFRLLEDKILHTFTEEEINLIVNMNRIDIDKICNYNEKQLAFIKGIIRNLEEKDDFNTYFFEILKHFDSYKELAENIGVESLSEEQKEKLKVIIQFENDFDIKTIDDIDHFESMKNNALQEIMNEEVSDSRIMVTPGVTKSKKIKEKKNALLLKMFGLDYDMAETILIEFSEMAEINSNLQLMKNIMSLNDTFPQAFETDKLLKEIFNDERISRTEQPLMDKIQLRKKYTKLYEEMYNDVLFKPEDGELITEKDGIQFYDAGTDFSVLSTSVAAYADGNARIDSPLSTNEKEMWNRKDLSSNHFCASFSRDDMIGIIQTNLGIYYGFNKIEPNSLLYMATEDSQSNTNNAIISTISSIRTFRNPNNMIDNTAPNENLRTDFYNEFDIKRQVNGIKQEPDYIIALKINGVTINEQQAIKTAKDWEKKKPIVVIDVDKCFEKSMQKLNEIILEYEQNPNNENLEKVWKSFHKTSITYHMFNKNDFIAKVNLPKDLRDNIENDEIKIGYYFLKDRNMFKHDKTLSEEEIRENIKRLMNERYNSMQEEKRGEANNNLTLQEIGVATLSEFKENPSREISISQNIIHEINQMRDNNITTR